MSAKFSQSFKQQAVKKTLMRERWSKCKSYHRWNFSWLFHITEMGLYKQRIMS